MHLFDHKLYIFFIYDLMFPFSEWEAQNNITIEELKKSELFD